MKTPNVPLLSLRIGLLCFLFIQGGEAMAQSEPCVRLNADEEAVQALPVFEEMKSSRLPVWANAFAVNNPHLTAAMLELDYKFRAVPPDVLRLRSLARLAVAQANECAYGMAYANYDLGRCNASELGSITIETTDSLPELERRIFRFARQMTIAARDVADEDVEYLKDELGERELVGLVLHIGYGNFQDRLVHALQLPLEENGPLPPEEWNFVNSTPNGRNTPSADRPEMADSASQASNGSTKSWEGLAIDDVQSRLSSQRNREARIRVPDWEEIRRQLPEGLYPRPLRIRWSRVVVGYQPVIGPAWIKCLRVFEQEAHQDRVFEESVFWVVTRGLGCFYCMGHCEMLMEVGGLDRSAIRNRTQQLASGDWSKFPIKERAAFEFAYKLTNEPSHMTCNDYTALRDALGEARALDCVWWTCRCHFMTKVSDAFQLQLESENVFAD